MKRSEVTSATDATNRIQRLYALLFARPATAEEVSLARQFLDAKEPPGGVAGKLTPWERLAQALLMTNEFVYID
jgi:hypothetical protein